MFEKTPNSNENNIEDLSSFDELLDALRSLKNGLNEPISLTREQRTEYGKNGTPEEKEVLKKYENSKYRGNWFHGLFLAIQLLEEETGKHKQLRDNPEFKKIFKEEQVLENDFKKIGAEKRNPIPKEIVERADALIEKMLNKFKTIEQ